jgi:hypothetical protein
VHRPSAQVMAPGAHLRLSRAQPDIRCAQLRVPRARLRCQGAQLHSPSTTKQSPSIQVGVPSARLRCRSAQLHSPSGEVGKHLHESSHDVRRGCGRSVAAQPRPGSASRGACAAAASPPRPRRARTPWQAITSASNDAVNRERSSADGTRICFTPSSSHLMRGTFAIGSFGVDTCPGVASVSRHGRPRSLFSALRTLTERHGRVLPSGNRVVMRMPTAAVTSQTSAHPLIERWRELA